MTQQLEIPDWVERAARLGYATKGAVYLLIGGLSAAAALRLGGRATDSHGALASLLQQPLGEVLLAVVAAGLAAYAAWRFVQGVFDAERKGSDLKGLGVRLSYVASGCMHAALAWTALKLALGWPDTEGDSPQQDAAQLLALPYGTRLVGGVGLGVVGFALVQFYKSYSKKFCRRLEGAEMTPAQKQFACRSGQFGLIARGIVFLIVGGFFLSAAWRQDSSEAGGLDDALRSLETQPYGSWLMAAVALGLAAYGLFMLVEARFHRIRLG
jgi:uncharacterized membrane protein YidH (DUF202 family)